MDEKERFENLWTYGDYRGGSTALRLVPLLMEFIPPGSTINDYGSGTGRADVELLKRGNYRITMIDIAENALEDDARALLIPAHHAIADRLRFVQSDLCNLPMTIKYADWGICINVLMTMPPEDVETALEEMHCTCDNLFVEVYDWSDQRLGKEQTLSMGDADYWFSILSKRWKYVQQIPSPESDRRYIFVCKKDVS
jgi:SAM-dependent methyltransferase